VSESSTQRRPALTAELAARLGAVRGVVFDIDGCLALFGPGHDSGTALPGAAELIAHARACGHRVVAFTNASSKVPAALAATLRGLGLPLADDEVLTPAVVAAEIVEHRYRSRPVLAFGGPGLVDVLVERDVRLADPGEPGIAAVVVGWDTAFGRDRLQAAAEALWDGADLLVTSDAPSFASRGRPAAGVSGFIAHGLRHVTGAAIEVVGKPSPAAMDVIARRLGVDPARMLVVGDDLTLEIRMARAAGAVAVLTTTGTHDADDAGRAGPGDRPDLVVGGLPELLALLDGAGWPGAGPGPG
jgi:HAD superfamily hydrolase (TIGR01450 family)